MAVSASPAKPQLASARNPVISPDKGQQIVFSVPFVNNVDTVFVQDALTRDEHESRPIEASSAPSPETTAELVPLSIPEQGRMQEFVQGLRRRFIDVAGQSIFWRLFVGSGVAVLIGALTLILLGPSPQVESPPATPPTIATSQGEPISNAPESSTSQQRAEIVLTVGTSNETGVPVQVEVEDPFDPANLVAPRVSQAVHFASEESGPRHVIQQVSQETTQPKQPAWLNGTIEEDAPAQPSTRNYERSRSSHR